MTVFLDRGHQGKPSRPTDMGAWADLDRGGRADWTEQEAALTLLYGHYWAAAALRAAGVDVIALSDGEYGDRHQRVNAYCARDRAGGPHIYVQLHLNASESPEADYGSIFYDHRSPASGGPRLAALCADALRQRAPELGAVKSVRAYPKRGKDTDWTARAFSTIAGIGPAVAICYEPAFLTSPKHSPLLTSPGGLKRIGESLAAGIVAYIREARPPST